MFATLPYTSSIQTKILQALQRLFRNDHNRSALSFTQGLVLAAVCLEPKPSDMYCMAMKKYGMAVAGHQVDAGEQQAHGH